MSGRRTCRICRRLEEDEGVPEPSSQQVLSLFGLYPQKPCNPLEISLVVIGVFCAGAYTTAKSMGSANKSESANMIPGCVMCIASLLCGSLNLALAGVLGATKLNVGVWSISKTTIAWLVVSGVFSFIVIRFSIGHNLSPSATAFCGNFNEAALVFLTLMLPFLRAQELPGTPYIYVIWAAVVTNIAAFSTYSWIQRALRTPNTRLSCSC